MQTAFSYQVLTLSGSLSYQ